MINKAISKLSNNDNNYKNKEPKKKQLFIPNNSKNQKEGPSKDMNRMEKQKNMANKPTIKDYFYRGNNINNTIVITIAT